MDKEKIERINELARKSRSPEGLTTEERAEQQALRFAYLEEFRASFTAQLDHTVLERPDGTREKLAKKPSATDDRLWREKEEQAVIAAEKEEIMEEQARENSVQKKDSQKAVTTVDKTVAPTTGNEE